MDNYQIRAEAKQLLKNLKGKYLLFAIPILYHLVILNISLKKQSELDTNAAALETASLFDIWSGPIFVLTISILSSFVMLSVYWTLLKVRRSQQTEVHFKDSLLALSHENFGKSFVTLLAKAVLLIFWYLPGLILIVLASELLFNFLMQSGNNILTAYVIMLPLFCLIALLSFLPFIIKTFSYAMTEFVLFDDLQNNQYYGPLTTIRRSKEIMKGHIWQLFRLELSFIGWWFLVGLSLGLAAIYVIPYQMTCRAIFYEHLRQKKEKKPNS